VGIEGGERARTVNEKKGKLHKNETREKKVRQKAKSGGSPNDKSGTKTTNYEEKSIGSREKTVVGVSGQQTVNK